MSNLPGGPADKAGLGYETLWGVFMILKVIHRQATEIRVEPPMVNGAEFYVQAKGGREYWQAKRQLLSQQTWTLTALNREGVLGFFLDQLRAGELCVFASVTDAPELRVLAQNATDAKDYAEFQSKFLSEKPREHFGQLCKYWKDIAESEVFAFLRRLRVEVATESTIEQMLLCIIDVSLDGTPHAVLDCLQQLYLNSVHKTLNSEAIQSHLEARGIKPRAANLALSLRDKLTNLTDSYLAGQRAKLIRGQVIPRPSATEIVDNLNRSTVALDIALIGSAGGGKSGCLFQVVNALRGNGVPVLAFRLDRVQPVQTTIALGEQLGLPESPAVVLARCNPSQPCVLVVDQLDFVSSTSGRHPDFFDTVAALIQEVRGLRANSLIHLVLVSRKFDFEHDHRFRSLLNAGQKPLELPLLDAEEVKKIVMSAAGNAESLSRRQIELLRLPQNLSLFIDSGLCRDSKSPFVTQKDLFDAYWQTKERELAQTQQAEMTHWKPLFDKITEQMSESQELSISMSQLDDFPGRFVTALVSSGMLSFDGNRYGFGHESLFDYCFARGVARGHQEFVAVLESDEQHLFRRAQLRQVLVYLRDEDFNRYIRNVGLTRTSPKIRPHLKLLVLELLGTFSDVHDEEFAMIAPLIESELACRQKDVANPDKMASRAFEVFFHSAPLFRAADRLGYLERWLNSEESRLHDHLTLYLRRQTEENADRVAELVQPFLGRDGPWKDRLRCLMEGRSYAKSRKFFDLFLRLIDDGTLDEARDRLGSNGTFWSMMHGLSARHPSWCAEVAAHWLNRKVAHATAHRTGDRIRVEVDDYFGVEDLFESARLAPKEFLNHVLPSVLNAADATKFDTDYGLPPDQVFLHILSQYLTLNSAYLGACEAALAELAKRNPQDLRPFISLLINTRLYTANRLLQEAYLTAPEFFGEEALALLVSEPERLWCGYSDGAFWITRRLIEKCSPYCQESTLGKLEAILVTFVTPFEKSKRGYKARGHAAFNLLSAIPVERRGVSTTARFEELERKFKTPDPPPQGIRSYSVGSPISEDATERMSDDNWLKAIAKHNQSRRAPDLRHPEKGAAEELAGTLRQLTEKEPERFAHLALLFPQSTNASYFMNVLWGLCKAPLNSDLKFGVVRKVVGLDDAACKKAALKVLASINSYPLPEDVCSFIKQLAVDDPDPTREEWQGEYPYYGGDILTHGINTVRGQAAETIRDLIQFDRRYINDFLPTIERMITDKTLAARSCVASTLLALAREGATTAINLFAKLVDADVRLLGTHYAERFLSLGIAEHFADMRCHIERTLRSTDPKVKQAGGRLACLARLCQPAANDLAEFALGSDSTARLGVAEVAKDNLLYGPSKEWCEGVLAKLFDDPAVEVREAARCFWHLWKNPNLPLANFHSLIAAFAKSKAFTEVPSMLLHALEESRQAIPETTLDVCKLFLDKCASAARDITTGIAADERTVGTLIFRSYAQFNLKVHALLLIDRMCEEGLHSASTNLLEFER